MALRVLSIGLSLGHDLVVNRHIHDAPALFDFDIIVLDPEDVAGLWKERMVRQEGLPVFPYDAVRDGGGLLRSWLASRTAEMRTFLGRPRLLICVLRPVQGVYTPRSFGDREPPWIDNYSWLPVVAGHEKKGIGEYISYGEGSTVRIADPTTDFIAYFRAFKDQLFHEAYLETDVLEHGNVKRFHTIARDYADHPISFSFRCRKATVVFLPPVSGYYDSEKMAGVLLQCILRAFPEAQRTPPPEWAAEYRGLLPGLESLDETAHQLTGEIKRLGSELKEVGAKQEALEGHLRLLYEQGKYQLEPAVREAFDLMGFEFDEYGEVDVVLDAPEGRAFVEVEGKGDDAIKVEKHSQLLRYVIDYQEDTGVRIKGILVGNAYRFSHPGKRASWFSDEVERGAQAHHFCLLTTEELFKVVCALLAVPSDDLKAQIRSAILNTVGYFTFSG